MSCECETYETVCIDLDPCNEGVTVDIIPDATGVWTGKREFNGSWAIFEIDVVNGEKIILGTHLLNENYVHEFKLYDASNELFGCYKLSTHFAIGATNATPIPVDESVSFLAYIGVAANPSADLVDIGNGIFAKEVIADTTLTDGRLAGLIVTSASMNGQSYVGATWNYTKPVSSGVFTWINGNAVSVGDVLILYTSQS